MAAVLCASVANCCKALGHCLTFPCSACGTCCSTCCSTLGRALSSPFTPYLLTTVVLNLPCVVWGLRTAVDVLNYKVSCQDSNWVSVNAILSFIHLIAAFYIVHRIQEDNKAAEAAMQEGSPDHPIDPEGENHTNYKPMDREEKAPAWKSAMAAFYPGTTKSDDPMAVPSHGEANSVQRLKQVFCYDVGVAVYIIIMLFWLIWQSVGISQVLFGKENDDSYVCENIERRTILSILCGFLYIMLVFVSLACGFCCLRQ
mmetsp:Transcript_14923/g.28500  ORF Transcript_14923/g.28500 Transcript_14923/m.28500 type:complete len:257 (+) Transcript_14923:190-960(+)|eukprot:scaffold10085_cov168-Amphora_coffeaeformis.AAC.3